jgi:hypothetical protein
MPVKNPKRFAATIKDGKLLIKDMVYFNSQIQELEGKDVQITLIEKGMTRSSMQNALYWKWLTILSHETGYTKEELHDILMEMYFGAEEKSIQFMGENRIFRRISSRTLTKNQMSEYMNWVKMKALEFYNIDLPNGFEYGYEGV